MYKKHKKTQKTLIPERNENLPFYVHFRQDQRFTVQHPTR